MRATEQLLENLQTIVNLNNSQSTGNTNWSEEEGDSRDPAAALETIAREDEMVSNAIKDVTPLAAGDFPSGRPWFTDHEATQWCSLTPSREFERL
jgi:hypothetical protein